MSGDSSDNANLNNTTNSLLTESLRIHGSIPDMRDNLHDQGSTIIDPYIVSDFEPSSIKEFSGAMRS